MSLHSLKDLGVNDSASIIERLAAELNFSAEQLAQIREAMASTNANFMEAAFSLNLLSPERADALRKLMAEETDRPSIIEVARSKALGRKSTVPMQDPDEKCEPSNKLTIAHDPYSERSEKLRGLRTELTLRFDTSSKAAMLAIVSAGNGEGRSQLAAELAVAFSQLDRRTLLVDADLRSPRLHELFNASNELGLTQSIQDGTQPYLFGVESLPNLHVIFSGVVANNPIELLSSKRFEQMVTGWLRSYDFVVFDTPAVATYADALTVSTLVKRVLITTRAGQTNIKEAKEMMRRLSITHCEVMGAVVNHF